ncbi:hypothetical protein F5Y12DRAFT_785476 [Xylaria sp. FL1777]|nr:hypothetical protein F5Y12DRAFT_785476 [Xylaria sp. FL1777]
MSLSLDDNQNSLHQCSKQALSRQLHQDDLRATFMKATSSSKESRKLPSVAECATHLELLQAFRHLRIEVQSSRRLDEVFGIKPENRTHATIDSESRDWAFQLSESDQAWFQDKCSLHPDLLGFLTEEQKSLVVRNCLENHGRSHDESQGRGLVPEDIPDVSSEQDIINLLERGFLDSCRVAVSKDDTVEKLVDAVKRQSVFVDKMDRQLWIRSPAVEGTLTRASVRYERFLKLFKLYPRTMLVPTLDVDIVWHTHQCSPAQYELATAEIAGRFIDHNDKLGAATLDPAFENTKALYRIRFADEYRNCLCWDCEGLRSAIASEDSKTDIASVAREAHSRVAYYRAVEIARQKGEKLLPIYRRKFSADDD